MFACLWFLVPLENFSLIWRRHHYRWRAANFDICSALMAIKQWGFISVPHLLPIVYQWSCHYLFLRIMSVALIVSTHNKSNNLKHIKWQMRVLVRQYLYYCIFVSLNFNVYELVKIPNANFFNIFQLLFQIRPCLLQNVRRFVHLMIWYWFWTSMRFVCIYAVYYFKDFYA